MADASTCASFAPTTSAHSPKPALVAAGAITGFKSASSL